MGGCGGPSAGDVDITVSAAAIEDVVEEAIDESPEPVAACDGRRSCDVTYTIPELVGIDTDLELLEQQRVVWAALFSDPMFDEGTITLRAPVVSVGGQESTDDVLRVRCDKAAARQIDWEAVDADGLKTLCAWQELVG